ncbi:MAG: hypothetical protein WBF90_13675 [Rivularia sp. (in: cyanobacteria)]|jgi:hypothetical protein
MTQFQKTAKYYIEIEKQINPLQQELFLCNLLLNLYIVCEECMAKFVLFMTA